MSTQNVHLSTNFSYDELKCKCGCAGGIMDGKFMEKLQRLRDLYKKPMIITSGFRCNNHNQSIKGAKSSQHLYGRAVDIHCADASERHHLVSLALQIGFAGVGIDATFIHIDTRPEGRKIWVY